MEGLFLIAVVILIVWGLRKLYKRPSFHRAMRDAADDIDLGLGGDSD